MQNTSVVFHSASDNLLWDFVQSQSETAEFWSFEGHGWVANACTGEAIGLFLIRLYLYLMRRQGGGGITPVAVTSLPMLPRAAAFDLKTNTIITTTTTPPVDIDAWITAVYKCEWLIVILMLLIFGLAMVIALGLK